LNNDLKVEKCEMRIVGEIKGKGERERKGY
jgi:hypothetical protein